MIMSEKHNHNLQQKHSSALLECLELHPAEPLWKRAPSRDESGKPLPDFMMLIPGLKNKCNQHIADVMAKLEMVLMQYHEFIIFADFNMKINALWVTLKPGAALTAEIAAVIHHHVPDAKLVSQHHH